MKTLAKIYLYVLIPWCIVIWLNDYLPEIIWKSGILCGWLFLIFLGMAIALILLLDWRSGEGINGE